MSSENKEQFNEIKYSKDFTGKVVLVTGSSHGIGEAIVKQFSSLGATVVVTGRRVEEVNRVVNEVQELSHNKVKPLAVVADVTKSDDLNRLLDQTIKTYGKLDVLVNNAAVYRSSGVRDKDFMETFDELIENNFRAYVELSHLSVPYLDKTNGNIINTSSFISAIPTPHHLACISAKVGVDTLTKVLALELGPNIRVNAISPGFTQTEGRGLPPEVFEAMLSDSAKRAPLKRVTQPLDVAKAAVFLASSDAQFITGANLAVDGGLRFARN